MRTFCSKKVNRYFLLKAAQNFGNNKNLAEQLYAADMMQLRPLSLAW